MTERHQAMAIRVAFPKRDGSEGRYTPDFVIHATGDRWMLVEVQMTGRRADPVGGEDGTKAAAIRKLADLDPDRIVYRMVFADQIVPAADVEFIATFDEKLRSPLIPVRML